MNIRKIYNLDTIDKVGEYKEGKWCDNDAFSAFVFVDLDTDSLMYEDAYKDERIRLELKATGDIDTDKYYHNSLDYYAISFDGQYIGLIIGSTTPWGWDCHDRYITNYPLYQAMLAYIQAMYMRKPDDIVGETVQMEDLDGRYGLVIDKRHKYNLRKEEKK